MALLRGGAGKEEGRDTFGRSDHLEALQKEVAGRPAANPEVQSLCPFGLGGTEGGPGSSHMTPASLAQPNPDPGQPQTQLTIFSL